MYLTRLTLNPKDRRALRDLASPYEMHRTLSRAFPSASEGGPGRVLFRVEPVRDGQPPTVLVQSDKEPNWSVLDNRYVDDHAVSQVVFTTENSDSPETIQFRTDDQLLFRLLANPTVKRDGKRHGLMGEEDQRQWLLRKAKAGGFQVDSDHLLIVKMGILRSRVRSAVRSWLAVRFEGRLTVEEPTSFVESLNSGIGSGKAFGFGLLSVASA